MPMTSASMRTERSTCLRVAPTQRSNAKSRSRWVNRIENVFAMTMTETKSAIAANSSSVNASTSTPSVSSAWRLVTKSSFVSTVAPAKSDSMA